ncbi:lipid kinase [Acidovorax facilis]|uniref:Lipid kinase n=1 Tax=Acidovorax facilis TaxID=12917 RepID=A0ABV8DI61_9BURK|nr:lipid kinase [Acidovorax facilis]MCO4243730.1 lipid kinase [Acidovorax facilis]
MTLPATDRKRALLFTNPSSRSGSDRSAEAAVQQLESSGLALTRLSCAKAADISPQVRRHAHMVDLVVIGGGDGTVNAALRGLMETGLPLGILPLGTANDLARTLRIPADPSAAAAVIIGGQMRRIDVGQVNDQFFINVASMGLSVELARRMTGNRKRHLGKLSYPVAALQTLFSAQPFTADVCTQAGTTQLESVQMAVGNGVYYGGGMSVFDRAAIDDQCLDFYSIAPKRFWQWPLLLSAFRRGRNRDLVGMRAFCSSGPLEIRTNLPLAVNTDGEITTTTPARFKLLPRALSVFAPAG